MVVQFKDKLSKGEVIYVPFNHPLLKLGHNKMACLGIRVNKLRSKHYAKTGSIIRKNLTIHGNCEGASSCVLLWLKYEATCFVFHELHSLLYPHSEHELECTIYCKSYAGRCGTHIIHPSSLHPIAILCVLGCWLMCSWLSNLTLHLTPWIRF